MDKDLKHKLIEIGIDKLLVGVLILLAGLLVNSSLERYKLVDAQRVADTSGLVQACSEIWEKVYEYEASLDDLDRERWMLDFFNDKEIVERKKKVEKLTLLSEQKEEGIKTLVSKSRFVLGENLTQHFWKYMGYLKMKSDSKNKTYSDRREESLKQSLELVKVLDKEIQAMRFNARDAREYAISKLPN